MSTSTSKPTATEAPGSEVNKPTSHPRFYFQTGDLVFQVENAIFKVHRHFLMEHSPVLQDMFSASHLIERSGDGEDDSPAFVLKDDSLRGWECILSLFYPQYALDGILNRKTDDYRNVFQQPRFTAVEWASILRVAHKYLMAAIEIEAMKGLQEACPPLDMVELMIVAQHVGSDELYNIALQSLAQRDQMLSFEEAEKIGFEAFYDVTRTEHVYFARTRREMRWS
ncbi:hypothetical protein PIIN_02559 [Serendipita indica DSM 11827]|uniref:BTB domain-containing protein n=1 Tax=Serendipita indica (strain DSM 11827) TaxID=1109443 RepID=G4TBJ9_SERID|nr:hypothetical protein PIIN_02559 [Serendipita indica DSM 11827]